MPGEQIEKGVNSPEQAEAEQPAEPIEQVVGVEKPTSTTSGGTGVDRPTGAESEPTEQPVQEPGGTSAKEGEQELGAEDSLPEAKPEGESPESAAAGLLALALAVGAVLLLSSRRPSAPPSA